MRIIEGLLSRAAHPNTPEPERIAAQEQADKLMAQYQIDRAMLNFNKKEDEVRQPIVREYENLDLIQEGSVRNSGYNWETGRYSRSRDVEEYGIQGVISGIRTNIFYHAGAKTAHQSGKIVAVGYEEDLIYAEMLWLTVFQDIVTKMFPTWNKEKGFDENVYNLKKAGYSWSQVCEIGLQNNAKDAYGPLTKPNSGSKLRSGFKRHARKIGEEVLPGKRQPSNPHLWRRSFVDSYSATISQRIAALKAGREEYFDKSSLPALVQDSDRVKQRFYELFPDLNPANRPEPTEEEIAAAERHRRSRRPAKIKTREADMSAWAAGNAAAKAVNLNNNKSAGDRKEALR